MISIFLSYILDTKGMKRKGYSSQQVDPAPNSHEANLDTPPQYPTDCLGASPQLYSQNRSNQALANWSYQTQGVNATFVIVYVNGLSSLKLQFVPSN